MSLIAERLRAAHGSPERVLARLFPELSEKERRKLLQGALDEARMLATDAKPHFALDDQDVVRRGDSPVLRDPAVEEAERSERDTSGGMVHFDGGVIERVLAKLKSLGLSDRDITEMSHMLQEMAGGNAEDDQPRNGLPGSGAGLLGRGGGMGGRLSEKMAGDRRMAFDARALTAHIIAEPSRSEIERRAPRTLAPSRAQLERLHRRFPGMAAIRG